MSDMDELARWMGEQLAIDAELASSADVKEGDPQWWVSHDLASDGKAYTVRSDRDHRPIARVQRLDGDEGQHAGVLDGHAVAEFIAENDPARTLREIEAKRLTLAQYVATAEDMDQAQRNLDPDAYAEARTGRRILGQVIRRDAAVYAHRPGYQESWRP